MTPLLLVVAVMSLSLHSAAALASSFAHDGKTTYCWRIPTSFKVKQPNWTDAVLSGEAKGCPISMELSLASAEVTAGEFVAVNWTVKLEKERFVNSANAVKQGAIFRIVDESSNTLVDVVHSNVHSCEFGSNCDPFRMGSKFVDNTPNKVGNFSKDGVLVFTSKQELRYPEPGIYSVLAHIILPSSTNATNERFDYAVYTRLTVKEVVTKAPVPPITSTTTAPAAPAPATTNDPSSDPIAADTLDNSNRAASNAHSTSNKLSSGVIAGIVLGGVAIVAIVLVVALLLRKRNAEKHGPPVLSPHIEHQLRPLRPVDKATFNDVYSEASVPVPGRQRLGAAPRSAPTGAAGPATHSGYLTSADPHGTVIVRGPEMDIRDFDNTYDDDDTNATSYFVSHGNNQRRSQPIFNGNSEYSVDFIYPDDTASQADAQLLQMRNRRHQHSDRSDDSYACVDGLDTNDSYIQYTDGEVGSTTRSSRVFSSASEASASVDSAHFNEFGERFSDVTDPHDVEL